MLQVPSSAILDLGEGPMLTVVRDGKTAVLHPEVGDAAEGWVAVAGTDLKEGEPVVVEGAITSPKEPRSDRRGRGRARRKAARGAKPRSKRSSPRKEARRCAGASRMSLTLEPGTETGRRKAGG